LRSVDEIYSANALSLRSAKGLETVPKNVSKALSAEAALRNVNLPGHTLPWLDTTKDDINCTYALGKAKVEAQTAIELFQ
jgi:hypothetical protein